MPRRGWPTATRLALKQWIRHRDWIEGRRYLWQEWYAVRKGLPRATDEGDR